MYKSDLTGKVFGRLTVTGPSAKGNVKHNVWVCLCECGKSVDISGRNLITEHNKSCGCLMYSSRNVTHGLSYSSEHQVWRDMWQRCTNPNNPYYHIYQDKVPPQAWKDFNVFYTDMGPRPGTGFSLDRIDTGKPYGPENCRWATVKQQNRNKVKTVYVEFEGQPQALANLAERFDVPYDRVYVRIVKLGWPVEKALTQPPRKLS